MYLYKKNIILVPADFDGESMAKGILSLDCYADKTVCSLRTYNLSFNSNLTLGVAINKKLNKISINGGLNNQKFELPLVLNNADNVSVVLVDIKEHNYNIVLWGSTQLNNSWRSTLEFMLEDEFEVQKQTEQQTEQDYLFNMQDCTNNQQNQIFDNQIYNKKQTQNFDNSNLSTQNWQNNDYQNNPAKSQNKNEHINTNFDDYGRFETENFKEHCLKNIQIEDTQNDEQKDDANLVSQIQNSINFAQDDGVDQTEILKNQNLDEFLDSVISLEQQDEDVAEFDENSSHLDDTKPAESTFYDRISYQIEKMFVTNEQEKILDEIIPNSKFCRIEFDDKSGHYVFGVVYENQKPKYLCYGVPAKKDSEPPKELTSYYQWLPVDISNENGDGYYMMYQDALTGKNISVEVI